MNYIKNIAIILFSFILTILLGTFVNWMLSVTFSCEFYDIQQSIVWIPYFIVGIVTLICYFIDKEC